MHCQDRALGHAAALNEASPLGAAHQAAPDAIQRARNALPRRRRAAPPPPRRPISIRPRRIGTPNGGIIDRGKTCSASAIRPPKLSRARHSAAPNYHPKPQTQRIALHCVASRRIGQAALVRGTKWQRFAMGTFGGAGMTAPRARREAGKSSIFQPHAFQRHFAPGTFGGAA